MQVKHPHLEELLCKNTLTDSPASSFYFVGVGELTKRPTFGAQASQVNAPHLKWIPLIHPVRLCESSVQTQRENEPGFKFDS